MGCLEINQVLRIHLSAQEHLSPADMNRCTSRTSGLLSASFKISDSLRNVALPHKRGLKCLKYHSLPDTLILPVDLNLRGFTEGRVQLNGKFPVNGS